MGFHMSFSRQIYSQKQYLDFTSTAFVPYPLLEGGNLQLCEVS